MKAAAELLEPVRELHREIRAAVLRSCAGQSLEVGAAVDSDSEGDTIYAIDRVSENVLVEHLVRHAADAGGIVLVAEGLDGGVMTLPPGQPEQTARFRVIVDPIDGTRGLMYQKRSAWILTGVAHNRGAGTRLADIELAVQTEIPLLKQHLSDELWAVRGAGAHAERYNRLDETRSPLELHPSSAKGIAHGYATISRFFPGARDELAAIDEEVVASLLGRPRQGKAACFEDQYAATGGQLYELAAGHDRFIADIRPLMRETLARRGSAIGICCHPYDVCTALIAEELGVIVTDPAGNPLDAAFDVNANVAWVGYANAAIRAAVEPALHAALRRRGLLPEPGEP